MQQNDSLADGAGITLWGRRAPEQGEPNSFAGHLVMFPSNWGMFDLYGRNMIFPDPLGAWPHNMDYPLM